MYGLDDKVKCSHIGEIAAVKFGMYQMLMMLTVNHAVTS